MCYATTLAAMRNNSNDKRLAEAVEDLATTITEIIESKIRVILEAAKAAEPVHDGISRLSELASQARPQPGSTGQVPDSVPVNPSLGRAFYTCL